MWIHAACWLEIDPLPVPPAPNGTTAYWRWHSARRLKRHQDRQCRCGCLLHGLDRECPDCGAETPVEPDREYEDAVDSGNGPILPRDE